MENFIIYLIYLIYFFFFYFGAIMGSFLNVLVFELEPNVLMEKDERERKGIKSFWKRINRHSHCNSCGHNLGILDLFPIFSYVFSMGKCRHCGAKFSPRYLFVEIFSGLIFLGLFLKLFQGNFDPSFITQYLFLTFITSTFILIFLFDLKHKIIPNLILYPSFILSFIYLWLFNFLDLKIFIAAILISMPFFAIYYFSDGKWMGGADWKVILLLSLFLVRLQEIYSFLVLSFWIGAIFSLSLMYVSKKYGLKSEIPFGPFLLIGFWLVYILNLNLIQLVSNSISLFN